jgi:hypothetical protein
MPKYRVSWKHEVVLLWTGTVEAESEEEALEELKEGNFSDEELVDEQDISVSEEKVEGLEEE